MLSIINKKETTFIIATMIVTLSIAILSAIFDWGYTSAYWLAIGMYFLLWTYAILQKDMFLKKLLIFGIAAGLTELIADNWLVNGIQELFYPETELKLWASPNYMPFAWAVVLIQVGYLGYHISNLKNMKLAVLVTFMIGMIFIPIFETCAKYAEWWYYVTSHKTFLNTPDYIILGEGLIAAFLPIIFRKEFSQNYAYAAIFGIMEGFWIYASYYLAYNIL